MKICPFMSFREYRISDIDSKYSGYAVNCQEEECMAWKEIFIHTNSKTYKQYGCVLLKESK